MLAPEPSEPFFPIVELDDDFTLALRDLESVAVKPSTLSVIRRVLRIREEYEDGRSYARRHQLTLSGAS